MTIEPDANVLRTVQTLLESGTPTGRTDAELLERFLARNDALAFEALVVRHGPMVLGVCRNVLSDRHDAEDAFQATFLILARRGRVIRRRDSLAGWLFGVAGRVAARARSEMARRRLHEKKAAEMQATRAERVEGPDVDFSAIHEEIARLPERYREPVVLCHLEAMTHEAAAEVLGCPVGTVSVRLMRARERLKARLSRRGLLVPGGLPATWSLPGPAVSARLVETTGKAALAVSARRAMVAGVVPASVLTLAQGVLKSMVVTQWKLTALFVLPVLLVGVGGGVILGQGTTAGQGPGGPPRKASQDDPPTAKAIDPVEKPEPADDPDAAARKQLIEYARRRRDFQRDLYLQGRITLDRYLDTQAWLKDAEVGAAATHEAKVAAVAHYVEELKEIEETERAKREAARSTMAEVEEAAFHRELAEMELRQTKRSTGHLDLESLDRRISALERKLDLILKALPRSGLPQ